MPAVDLQPVKARSRSSYRRGTEGVLYFADLLLAEFVRRPVTVGKGKWAGAYCLPGKRIFRQERLAPGPGKVGACLASGVCDLNARHRSLFLDKTGHPYERIHMRIGPDSQVTWSNPAVRLHCRRLRDD